MDARDYGVTEYAQFDHKAEVINYGGQAINYRTEVGLLNRNIIIRPSFDGISYTSDGAHLYLIGDAEDGLDVKISNVEFDHCGHRRDQVSCLYFHANGDFSGSYIRGISIHESSARGIVLEGEISSV